VHRELLPFPDQIHTDTNDLTASNPAPLRGYSSRHLTIPNFYLSKYMESKYPCCNRGLQREISEFRKSTGMRTQRDVLPVKETSNAYIRSRVLSS
jgi:hypothetical protein